jgi:hypothetical protein
MGDVQRYWAGSLHSINPDRLLYGVYVRDQVVFASDYDALRAELATATTAYELVRGDCHNLTEKVIPNLRAELAALREAAGKVTCWRCRSTSQAYTFSDGMFECNECPDCADLRKLLGEKHE